MKLGKQLQMARHRCRDQASADIRSDLDCLQQCVRIIGLGDHANRNIPRGAGSIQLRSQEDTGRAVLGQQPCDVDSIAIAIDVDIDERQFGTLRLRQLQRLIS